MTTTPTVLTTDGAFDRLRQLHSDAGQRQEDGVQLASRPDWTPTATVVGVA